MVKHQYLNAVTKNQIISKLKTGDLVKIRSDYIFLPFVFHFGIISIEENLIYIYHFSRDKENKYGGSLIREEFKDYIKGREIISVESLNLHKKDFYKSLEKLKKTKYDVFTSNCEHFVNFIKKDKPISPQMKKWGLGISLFIVAYLFIKKK
jgi:hypothetical protein